MGKSGPNMKVEMTICEVKTKERLKKDFQLFIVHIPSSGQDYEDMEEEETWYNATKQEMRLA